MNTRVMPTMRTMSMASISRLSRLTQHLVDAVRKVRIEEENVEPEDFRSDGDCHAHLTEPDDAQGLISNSCTAGGSLSDLLGCRDAFSVFHGLRQPGGTTIQIQNHAQRCVGHFFDVERRNIADGDALVSCGFDINVVVGGAYANDEFQRFEFSEIFFLQRDGVPNQGGRSFVENFLVNL